MIVLLYSCKDQVGLELCPGREVLTDFGTGKVLTPIDQEEDAIVCRLGINLCLLLESRFARRVLNLLNSQALVG